MNEKHKTINFLEYRNKISNNNHKDSGLQYIPLVKRKSKINLIKKSNSCIFPIFNPINSNETKVNNIAILENQNQTQSLIYKKIKIRRKQSNTFTDLKKSLTKSDNISVSENRTFNQIRNKNYSLNNIYNYKKFYNFICLGKNIYKSEIEKVSSPLIKYYLYSVFQNNKRHFKLNKYLKNQITKENITNKFLNIFPNSNPSKTANTFKQNNVLIRNVVHDKFNHTNYKNKTNNFRETYKNCLSKNINNDNLLNTEEKSHSEDNQIKSMDLEKLNKKENIRKEFSYTKSKIFWKNFSSFFIIKKSKKIKLIEKPYNNIFKITNY